MYKLYLLDALLGLATAQAEQQNFNEARATLERLQTKHPGFKPNEADLLRARTLEGCGDPQAALQAYEALLPLYVGLEARYRHALLLKKMGHTVQARSALEAMQDHARKHRVSHDGELAWLGQAKKELG